jgi:ABC-type sugar transport system permease subunit
MSTTVAMPRQATDERARRGFRNTHARTGALMAAPSFLLILVLTLLSVGRAIYESTYSSSPIFPTEYVGFGNYRAVVDSPYFATAARNTLTFTLVTVPIMIVLGVLVALLLNERFVGNTLLRIGMILPWAMPPTVAGLIWKWIFDDSYGALNAGLYSSGIIDRYVQWLTNPDLARAAVVVVFVWSQLPLAAIFLLASVQAVPDDLYDAAALDGAGPFGRFWTITLPAIRPMIIVVAIFEALMAVTNFDITYSLTQGGPGSATTLLTYFTWAESFKMLDFGRGSALAIMIALGSLAAILVLIRAMPRDALLEDGR